ncbi:MAG: hypothetical protein KJ601_06345 [Nanoarchaeota archaeon]|nr:hypothetical protein [Nanoarchaeota archaeon]MBU1704418.1 hypothetical protein [Nanoarchaeota archaeon]
MKRLFVYLLFALVIGKFYMSDANPGGNFELYSVVRNTGTDNLYDVNMKLYLYDLGEMWVSQGYTIQDHDHEVMLLEWEVPKDIAPGAYLARLSAGNDHVRASKHVYVTVN